MSIGKILREKREEKKLSLEDVSSATRINKKYIHALEDENFLLIPSQVYAKGFLKAYSELLGLDTRALLGELANYYKSREEKGRTPLSTAKISKIISLPKAPKLPQMPKMPELPKMPKLPKIDLNKYGAFILAFLVIVLIILLSRNGILSFKMQRQELIKANPPAVGKIKAAKAEQKKTAAVKDKIEVKLILTGRSSIHVAAGNKDLYNNTPGAGVKLRFVGKEIKVKASNGGSVKVYINGKLLGPMGKEGTAAESTYKAPQ